MIEHSPEPWEWKKTGPIDAHIVAADGTQIVGGERCEGYVTKDDPNIQRIVACVNTLAGIPDEALPAVQKFFDSLLRMPVRVRPRQLPDVEMADILEAFLNATKNESH